MLRTVVLVASLSWAVAAAGSAEPAATKKRAYEVADVYGAVAVLGLDLSRDGSRVAFTVKRYDLPKGETWSEVWTAAPDGSNLRQLTFGRNNDTEPRFSPDGKQLAFVSSRSGSSQIHLIPLEGGESRQLTDFPGGVGGPVWSPDGRHLAVSGTLYPECGIDAACNEKLAEDLSAGDLQVRVADELFYRHWTSWRDGSYSHVLLVDAASGKVKRDLTPGAWDSPPFSAGGGRGYAFSPDGQELCYVSNRDRSLATSTNSDLWTVPVEGRDGKIDEQTAVNLTAGNPGWDGAPLYSPDGRWIAYRTQKIAGYESALFQLALYDRQAKQTRILTDTANFDNWVDEMTWAADSKSLVFQGEVAARTPLFRIDVAGGKPALLVTDGLMDSFRLTPDGRSLLYVRRHMTSPYALLRLPLEGNRPGQPVQLTRFNDEFEKEVDLRPAEEMWVDVAGTKVHVFVIKPHGFDPKKKYPLILNVHGGPQMQWTDSYRGDWQVYPGKGYVVAFANPAGSTGYGQAYTDAIGCDWGGRPYEELMKVTDALEKLPYVDRERIGAMGWSYGGYMMMWFAGHTRRFKALASMMGNFDLAAYYGATEELWFPEKDLCGTPWTSDQYEKWSPSRFVKEFKTPTLVITGELDFRLPYTQSLAFFTALRRQDVPARLVVFPNAGHWPGWKEMVFYYNAHLDWFHRWLGGEPAPYDVQEHARNRAFKVVDAAGEKKSE